jgi:hypothetical protein
VERTWATAGDAGDRTRVPRARMPTTRAATGPTLRLQAGMVILVVVHCPWGGMRRVSRGLPAEQLGTPRVLRAAYRRAALSAWIVADSEGSKIIVESWPRRRSQRRVTWLDTSPAGANQDARKIIAITRESEWE